MELSNYLPISVFLVISLAIATALLIIAKMLAKTTKDKDKLSSYECGFEPFDDARSKFDIRFYLVAMLFIIFDLEIVFLIPWAVELTNIGWFGFGSMMFFLFVLTIGFIYEWKSGALNWE
ncbi:MAG: NADH-quinone oxidoreductase subunit A [Rickettsiaceae bacterium]